MAIQATNRAEKARMSTTFIMKIPVRSPLIAGFCRAARLLSTFPSETTKPGDPWQAGLRGSSLHLIPATKPEVPMQPADFVYILSHVGKTCPFMSYVGKTCQATSYNYKLYRDRYRARVALALTRALRARRARPQSG